MEIDQLPIWEALYMCFDLETTGVNVSDDRIVQIAVSYFHRGKVVQQHTQLIHPGRAIPEGASKVHGVWDKDVADQPSLSDFIERLKPHLRGEVLPHLPPPVLLGYNIIAYDVPLFKNELSRMGEDQDLLKLPMIDLIYFARWHLRHHRSLKLVNLCEHFGVKLDHAHDALFDAKACGELLPLFHRSGYLPQTVGEMIEEQSRLIQRQEEEYQRYKRWLYHDRQTGELMLGQSQYIGTPLARVDKGFLRHCLDRYDGIPELVQEAFRAQLS